MKSPTEDDKHHNDGDNDSEDELMPWWKIIPVVIVALAFGEFANPGNLVKSKPRHRPKWMSVKAFDIQNTIGEMIIWACIVKFVFLSLCFLFFHLLIINIFF